MCLFLCSKQSMCSRSLPAANPLWVKTRDKKCRKISVLQFFFFFYFNGILLARIRRWTAAVCENSSTWEEDMLNQKRWGREARGTTNTPPPSMKYISQEEMGWTAKLSDKELLKSNHYPLHFSFCLKRMGKRAVFSSFYRNHSVINISKVSTLLACADTATVQAIPLFSRVHLSVAGGGRSKKCRLARFWRKIPTSVTMQLETRWTSSSDDA